MKQLKSHVRHEDPEIMLISHIHVLLLSSAISLIVSRTLPSCFPFLVLELRTTVRDLLKEIYSVQGAVQWEAIRGGGHAWRA